MTLEQKTLGNYGVCCRSTPLPYKTTDTTIEEHFNSEQMQSIRDELETEPSEYVNNYCAKCIYHENSGLISRRQHRINQLLDTTQEFKTKFSEILQKSIDKDHIKLEDMQFYSIEFKFFGNLCNLQCLMCHPHQSSSIASDWKKRGKWNKQTHFNLYREYTDEQKEAFYKEMDKMLPNTLQVKFTGGEPLMNEDILDLVQYMVDKGYSETIELTMITNGTKLPQRFIDVITQFKRVKCMVSTDGVFEYNDYQRVNSDFFEVDKTIKKLKALDNVEVLLGSAITAVNIGNMDELYRYANHLGLYVDLTNIVLTPAYMNPQVLPQDIKNKFLAKYKSSKNREKFEQIIQCLESDIDELERMQKFAKLIYHLEEKDKRDGTDYRILW